MRKTYTISAAGKTKRTDRWHVAMRVAKELAAATRGRAIVRRAGDPDWIHHAADVINGKPYWVGAVFD